MYVSFKVSASDFYSVSHTQPMRAFMAFGNPQPDHSFHRIYPELNGRVPVKSSQYEALPFRHVLPFQINQTIRTRALTVRLTSFIIQKESLMGYNIVKKKASSFEWGGEVKDKP